MKRFIMLIMAVSLILPMADAQNKLLNKALQKEYKAKMKEFKKGGYEIFGSTRSLDVALLKHYEALESGGDNVFEVTGFSAAKSYNLAAAAARNSAANTYATMASNYIKGRMLSDMASDVTKQEAEFDKFYAAYETKVEQEIRGELRPSFSVMRKNSDGTISVQAFYLVNEDAASRARIKAFQLAKEESEAAQKYASRVSDFVNERAIPEN